MDDKDGTNDALTEIYAVIKNEITNLSLDKKIAAINNIKQMLHEISPMNDNPVDCVLWVKSDLVQANDYNPNRVAPPEMKLLEISIANDGFTQPVVTYTEKNRYIVVDGFHRTRVSKESKEIQEKLHGYTPVTIIRDSQKGRKDRIASTIRHNRARGKHIIDAMSEIVLELKNRNWKTERIARELGMDNEEILRLCQISGLEDIFKDDDFNKSWLIEDSVEEPFEGLTDEVTEQDRIENGFRTLNTNDKDRIFHTYDKWECYKAGFYNTTPPEGMSADDCEKEYARFLSDDDAFRDSLNHIIKKWRYSCEHYLTNKSMNRVAWLGQAALSHARGIPSKYCGGFYHLNLEQQNLANQTAYEYLNMWLETNGYPTVSFEEAYATGRQIQIY